VLLIAFCDVLRFSYIILGSFEFENIDLLHDEKN